MTVPFTVPTGDFDPDNGTPEFFEGWIQRIQGATLSGTGITEEERELLLHFALGYRAFYTEHDDISIEVYYEFVSHLVTETLALCPPESAAYTLEAAMEWLFGNLPADVFDYPDIKIPPIMPYREIINSTENAKDVPHTQCSPTRALIEMCSILVPAWTSYSVCATTGALRGMREGQSVLSILPTAITTERAFLTLLTVPQTDAGYESDDSMLSLHYVADSSDDE